MSIKEYVEQKKNIQRVLLEYIDYESDAEENYESLIQVLKKQHVIEERHDMKELLYLINIIGDNHYRSNTFFHKVEQILQHLKETITKLFSNNEIFEIFKNNKRILLFLIEEKIIQIDEHYISTITNENYIAIILNIFIQKSKIFSPKKSLTIIAKKYQQLIILLTNSEKKSQAC